jgi:N-acyl-D-aspartate/D-glutamate deacylase
LAAGATDPAVPAMLRPSGHFAAMMIEETFSPETKAFAKRNLGEVAQELGKSPADTFFDIALADDLKTIFKIFMGGDDEESWRLRGQVWRDPRTLVGASDAGAHIDMIDTFAFSTTVLSEGVRKRNLLTLEEAIYEITEKPARFLGLRERGRLAEGWHADVVVFDPARVGKGPIHTRSDLPGGATRLYCEAEGISHVLVNGEIIVQDNQLTGKQPGTILRSGRDTETVPLDTGIATPRLAAQS